MAVTAGFGGIMRSRIEFIWSVATGGSACAMELLFRGFERKRGCLSIGHEMFMSWTISAALLISSPFAPQPLHMLAYIHPHLLNPSLHDSISLR
ncbi:hypothetical protein BDR22DRAFT_874275 [Usnea florida]